MLSFASDYTEGACEEILQKLARNIFFHINIRHFHFVRTVTTECRAYALIVDNLIRIRHICIAIVKVRRKLMKKRE